MDKINLSNFSKKFILVFADIWIIIFAVIFSYSIRLDTIFNPFNIDYRVYLIFVSVFVINFYFNNVYQIVISFFDNHAIIKIIYVVLFSQVILFILNTIFYKNFFFPRSISIIAPIISGILFVLFRIILNYLINIKYRKLNFDNKILIYGINEKSLYIFKNLKNYPNYGKVVAFIETKDRYKKREIGGIKIFKKNDIDRIIKDYKITEIIINSKTFSKKNIEDLYQKSEKNNIRIKNLNEKKNLRNFLAQSLEITPNFFEIIDRPQIKVDTRILSQKIKNKNILVTGGGGSIGSELCIEILKHKPLNLYVVDNSEINLFNFSKKIENYDLKNLKKIEFVLGDCTDLIFLKTKFKNKRIDEIYHTAAYKHVGFSEDNLYSLIKNNIYGTKIILDFSLFKKVKSFIFISTDKAVNPKSILGYTKKIGEKLVRYYSSKKNFITKINFTVVRFGNVVGSSGSVIPIFLRQLKENRPLTVTHKNVSRYFMSISEAVQLIINSSYLNNGRFNIFALDMGKQIKIYELAKRIIRLSGYSVKKNKNSKGDILINLVGLKKGEKIKEEITLGKNLKRTKKTEIFLCEEKLSSSKKLDIFFNEKANLKKINKDLLKKLSM